jgi:hypothetical protein
VVSFSTKTLYTLLSSFIHATCPVYLVLHLMARITVSEVYRWLSSSLCSFLYSPVTSSLLCPNILLSTLFSNTLGLRSSLNVNDKVSHPYKTTGKNMALCTFILNFLDNKLEDKRFCTEWWQAFPEFNRIVIWSRFQFWFLSVILKYWTVPPFMQMQNKLQIRAPLFNI